MLIQFREGLGRLDSAVLWGRRQNKGFCTTNYKRKAYVKKRGSFRGYESDDGDECGDDETEERRCTRKQARKKKKRL